MDPAAQIDEKIASLDDWRGETFAQLRELINKADSELEEGWKWSTAVWSKGGLVCAVGAFKSHVKVNFFQGASLDDPKGLFNAGLDSKKTRSIDFNEGDKLNKAGLTALVRAAIAHNA
jgi:hypothetical protein